MAPRRGGHGLPWNSKPTPAGTDPGLSPQKFVMPGGQQVSLPASRVRDVTTVEQPNGFLNALPKRTIQFFLRSGDARFDHSLVAGERQTIASFTVEQNTALVINEVYYYATSPGHDRQAQCELLGPAALIGIAHFDLLFGDRTPLTIQARRTLAYAPRGAEEAAGSSGWPWVDRTFGPERVAAAALYARSGETLVAQIVVDSPPRFPIGRVGVEITGFSVPDNALDGIWDATKRTSD